MKAPGDEQIGAVRQFQLDEVGMSGLVTKHATKSKKPLRYLSSE